MSIRRTTTLSLGAIALAAAALAPVAASAQTGNGTMSPMAKTAAADKMSRSDQGYLRDIAQANMAEVAAGKVALEKSQNADVKKFAQMMVDDHGKALGEVEQLAQSKNVKLPDGPDVKHKAVMVEFKALSGATFDKRYIKQAGLGDHKATQDLLKKTQAKAADADLKALAAKMQPVVDEHLKHAQDMAKM